MKKLFVLMILFLSVFVYSCSSSKLAVGSEIALENVDNIAEVAKVVSPAIVGISGSKSTAESVGSGVCVTKNGYILTNSHVVNGCDNITLYLSDKSKVGAEIIYEDTVLDLAILRSEKCLPYLNLGDSDSLDVGQEILAVGTPLSLSLVHTFTKGIVSAVNRTLKVSNDGKEGYMQNLIQHDASLNPGNSGGPLINSRGEVVGINTLKISSGEGIGFAIPSKSFKSLLASFVENINYEIPYLGVYGFDNDIANFYDMTDFEKGFYVLDVSDGSPLNNFGISAGSVITKINDKDIGNTLDLKNELYKCKSGDRVTFEIVCKDQVLHIATKLK